MKFIRKKGYKKSFAFLGCLLILMAASLFVPKKVEAATPTDS